MNEAAGVPLITELKLMSPGVAVPVQLSPTGSVGPRMQRVVVMFGFPLAVKTGTVTVLDALNEAYVSPRDTKTPIASATKAKITLGIVPLKNDDCIFPSLWALLTVDPGP